MCCGVMAIWRARFICSIAFSGRIRLKAKGETQYWVGATKERRVSKVIIVFLDLQPVHLDDSSTGQVVESIDEGNPSRNYMQMMLADNLPAERRRRMTDHLSPIVAAAVAVPDNVSYSLQCHNRLVFL